MRYLCLIYVEEKKLEGMSREEAEIQFNECLANSRRLKNSRNYIAADPLEPVETATTIRVRGGKMTMTDGPFAETKEQLAGYYLIEAGSREEALRIASQMPQTKYGSVEVRPVKKFDID